MWWKALDFLSVQWPPWGLIHNTSLSDYIADDDELEPKPNTHQIEKNNQKKRKSGHLVLAELGNDDEEGTEEKLAKRSAKKVKLEPTPQGQNIEAGGNGLEGPSGRIAKSLRKKKTGAPKKRNSDVLDEQESPGEDGKETVKVEQLGGTADLNAKAGVKTEPETVTKPPQSSRRGKPSKALKVRDAEEDANTAADASAGSAPKLQEAPETEEDLEPATTGKRTKRGTDLKVEYQGEDVGATASTPAQPEQETAPEPEPEKEKPKAKTGKKKGIAKAVAKHRISKSFFLCLVPSRIGRISRLC